MILGEVFQSLQAWQKLSGLSMRPQVAFKVYRYTKDVSTEVEHVQKMRESLIRELSGVSEGEVKIEHDTPEFNEFVRRFNEALTEESELKPLNMKLGDVLDKIKDDDNNTLTVTDMAMLEPFFQPEEE